MPKNAIADTEHPISAFNLGDREQNFQPPTRSILDSWPIATDLAWKDINPVKIEHGNKDS